MARPTKHDWDLLREEWINQNLVDRSDAYTLKMLSEDHKLDYSYVQNKSAEEGWYPMLKERQGKSTELAKNSLARSRVFNELEVRVRQATYGTLAQSKAAVRLNAISPEKLTIREAIDLMRLGSELERKALSMPEHFVYSEGSGLAEEDFTSEKAKQVFKDVITLLEQDDGTFAADDDDTRDTEQPSRKGNGADTD